MGDVRKVFGYDSKAQNARVDAAKLARDQAYVDARKIEQARNMMLNQIPGIQQQAHGIFAQAAGMREQAGLIRGAGDQAAAIGRQNASNILAETGEWARRRGGEQKAEQSMNRALAAASGIKLDTGGSSDIFRQAVKTEHGKELAWGRKAGANQADIARRQGEQAATEARAMGEGVLASAEGIMAQIPGVKSTALRYGAEAGALRTSADVAVAEARAARSSAKSGAYMNIVSTALSVAGLGVAMGGASAGLKALGYTTAALAGASAIGGILASRSSNQRPGQLYSPVELPNTKVGKIPGVNAGAGVDLSKVQATAPQATFKLPAAQKATAATKKQYLAQVKGKKTELNMFGGSSNPLAAVG
jgi:hypothetical protein